jgi:hypothetical protein
MPCTFSRSLGSRTSSWPLCAFGYRKLSLILGIWPEPDFLIGWHLGIGSTCSRSSPSLARRKHRTKICSVAISFVETEPFCDLRSSQPVKFCVPGFPWKTKSKLKLGFQNNDPCSSATLKLTQLAYRSGAPWNSPEFVSLYQTQLATDSCPTNGDHAPDQSFGKLTGCSPPGSG